MSIDRTEELESPTSSPLRKIFGAERIPGTWPVSLLLAASLTVMPVALLLFGNQGTIEGVGPILTVGVSAFVVATVCTAMASKVLAPHVAAGIVGAFGYGFFSMSWAPPTTGPTTLLLLWVTMSFVGSIIVIWLLSNSRIVITLGSVMAAGLVVYLVTSAGLANPVATDASEVAAPPAALSFTDPLTDRPNVYVFILDGFGRPDIVERQFGAVGEDFDISEQVETLEGLGFAQDPSASANYTQSILSIPSTLNGELHHVPGALLDDAEIWARGRPAVKGDNFLINSLKAAGYDYWHSGSVIWDVSSCDVDIADRCLGTEIADLESKTAVWSLTPVRHYLGSVDFADVSDPSLVIPSILEARQTQPSDEPYVVFSHIVSPHQPYRFEPDCSFRGRADSGTTLGVGHLPEHRALYADQASCLMQQLESTMAELVEADPSAIILLQADHGPAFEADQETLQWDDTSVRERLGIFRMTRLPDHCRSVDPQAQSLVNTPELILSCLRGEQPEWVEPRIVLRSLGGDIEFEEPLVWAE